MDVITKDQLARLVKKPEPPALSIYMPTYRSGPEVRQNAIRFKNLLGRAERMLDELKIPVDGLLEPIRTLYEDSLFWSHQADGLAVFLSSDLNLRFRLPVKFDELVVVTDTFHTKPLLALLGEEEEFYVLAMSQKGVRLLRCSRQHCKEATPEGVPRGIDEALKYDDPQSQLQFHTGATRPGGRRPAQFHGHGVGIDDSKENLRRYLHQVDKGLRASLHDQNIPLITAGVDPLVSLYREINSYPHLLEEGIEMHPDALPDDELHLRAWEVVEPYFKKVQRDQAERYRDLTGTGLVSNDLEEIVPAAYYGRVEVLFLAFDQQYWGIFDEEQDDLILHDLQNPGDQDLLDFAALHTMIKGGAVYAVPEEQREECTPICAIFRY